MTQPTNTQLKQALAEMLPTQIYYGDATLRAYWHKDNTQDRIAGHSVLDTELLHLCWMVEETLDVVTGAQCGALLDSLCANDYNTGTRKGNTGRKESASWQQRVIALCKVKGIAL